MAEAHSAVAFSFSVTHEGIDFDVDWDAWKAVWYSGYRSWRKRGTRYLNILAAGMFPIAATAWPFFILMVALLKFFHFYGKLPIASILSHYLPWPAEILNWVVCVLCAGTLWVLFIIINQYLLRIMLLYQRWMFEPFGKSSKTTKIWAITVKILIGTRLHLYGLQNFLPRLPVPKLHDTMQRYLKTVRPLLDDEQYARMKKLAEEFESSIGPRLQRYLNLKSWWATNYVSDWWEEYVYLRGRAPLMVNSNYYAIDAIMNHPTKVQSARAANCIHALFKFRRLIYYRTLKPIMFQNLVPLCSSQYERTFNTTRIPGIEGDKLKHHDDSQHVVVYHKGRFFKLQIYNKGHLMEPCEIEVQIRFVLDDQTPPAPGESVLAALTAGERKSWAIARKQYFSKGVNRASLETIERAAFFVALDEEEQCYDPHDFNKLDRFAGALLHGKGYDRWFDKSFTFVVFKNGTIGLNAEHSWADAPIMAHLLVETLAMDHSMGYNEEGRCRGTPNPIVPIPVKLGWNLKSECQVVIKASLDTATALLTDVDLRLLPHGAYGKGFIKKTRISPDAYIQMALQLAYFKDAGKFNLTYEASMTRLFKEGRTETVRTVSGDSCSWVRSMLDSNKTDRDRRDLLKLACDNHVLAYKHAMTGDGIDRHLFCLYVVSRYLGVESAFLKEVLSEPWRLSTSQTTHLSAGKVDFETHKHLISAGGGFGPVADDGYGVSYIIAGEDMIYFHISSKKSSPVTDSLRFKEHLSQAMRDIRILLESDPNFGKSKKFVQQNESKGIVSTTAVTNGAPPVTQ